jgi:hypothetical protein
LPAAFRGRGEALDVTTATTGVAGRYASALFELADGSKSLDQVAQDLDTFRKMVAESTDLARLIASPVIPRALQGKALLAVLDAAGISGLTRNFVGTVAANGRARDLPAMASAFRFRPPSCSSSATRCAPCWAVTRFPSTHASNPTFSAVSS